MSRIGLGHKPYFFVTDFVTRFCNQFVTNLSIYLSVLFIHFASNGYRVTKN